ncbi:phage major capsid protein [Achromobacter xylosoxidans]
MKTFAEQVADLQATRVAKVEESKSIARKAADESRSMDSGEAEQFDTLQGEIKRLDDDIARYSRLADIEKADKASAKPIDGKEKSEKIAVGGADRLAVQVKNTEKLEPGMGFARVARVKALAHVQHMDPIQIAKSLYPDDEKLVASFTKAAVPAANSGNAGWGGNLILDSGAYFADFVEYLRARTVVGQISDRLRRLPFDTPVLIQSTGGAGKWVKEGAAKPLTSWSYSRAKLQPLKVAAIAAATKEMLGRASEAADALIRDELSRAASAAIDGTFVSDAAAVTDESPAGIRNGTTAMTLTGDGSIEGIRCDAAAMLKALVGDNLSISGAFWVMPETVAIDLATAITPLGAPAFPGMTPTGGTFLGLPAFASQYTPTDSSGSVVMLIKGDEIFLGDEGGIQVSMSDQASLVMDDSPSMNSTTPTAAQVVSMFQTNSVAFLVERFLNWQKRRSQAVVWASVNWNACA